MLKKIFCIIISIVIMATTVSAADKTQPIYKVYKNGWHVKVSAADQWLIRDWCEKYNINEPFLYGIILNESCFKSDCITSGCYGWTQISKFWLRTKNIERFADDDPRQRDLLDKEDHLLTLAEIWNYAITTFNIDLDTEDGYRQLLYWHASGRDPRKKDLSSYSHYDKIMNFAAELVEID